MPSCLLDESVLRALFETSEDAILEVSLDGKIVRWNRGAEKLYGYSEAEMREQSLAQLIPICEVPLVEAFLLDLQRDEIPGSEATERMQRDGTCISVAVRRMAIRDERGRVTGMVESARALEPRANDSPAERQLRLLVEQMPVMMWTTDRQLRITSNWGSGFQLSKGGPGKLVGRTVPELLHCDDTGAGPVIRHWEALRGTSSRFEYKCAGRVLDMQVEPLRSCGGEIIGSMGVALDITDRKKSEQQMLYQATHDALTGLANYRGVHRETGARRKRASRSRNSFAVLLLDLDGLKQINDRSGHLAGNRALKRLANAMHEHCRSIDLAARYGGDEFALVLIDADPATAEHVAERIRRCLRKESDKPPLGVSIGIASYPADGRTGQELLESADQRLYLKKKETRKKSLTAR